MTPSLRSALVAVLSAPDSGVASAWLFGSEARGTARRSSDVDVAVLMSSPVTGTLADIPLDLEGKLEAALGRSVQVLRLDTVPVDVVHEVLSTGILLLDHDPARRVSFEVKTRNEYFDLLPVLQRYRRAVTP